MAFITKRTAVMAMALVLVSTIAANAEPQHRGGRGPGFGGPRHFSHGPVFPGFFYGPYYPYYPYSYGLFPFEVYPYSAYAYGRSLESDVRVKVTPKQAQVFVDGYYAGEADKFDGAFQRLHVTPGAHVITVYLDGYRTLSRSIYAGPGATVTFDDRMQPVAPGEVSAPPPAPADRQGPPKEPGR